MNSIRALLAVGLVLLLHHLPSPVFATSVVPMELPELVETSTAIVHGVVLDSRSRWNEDHSLILTDVRVRVRDAIKGTETGEVVITQLGGTIGKLRVEVPGARPFGAGEEVVVFLSPGPRGDLFVTGLTQGRLEVVRDPQTGQKVVRGPALVRWNEPGTEVVEGAVAAPPPELSRFLRRVRRVMEDIRNEGGN